MVAEHWLTVRGTVGLWRCRREGDDVFVLAGNEEPACRCSASR